MVNRVDGAILGVGVVVLVASILGVVLYDETGGTTFTISWSEEEAATLDERSDSGGAGEFTFEIPVNGTRISSVVHTVEVAANGQQINDDSVDVSVEGPGGETGECSFMITATGGSNSCDAEAQVTESPTGFTVSATNRTAAEDKARERVASDDGTGTWTVTVTIDGGTEIQEPSYDVTVIPSVFEWTPQAQLPSGGGSGPG